MDDFVYFSEDPAVEALFERLLRERVKVDFMGLVEWFLGIHFSWRITKFAVDVHMNQSGFAANLVKQFCHDEWDHTPDATPYQSGVPMSPSTHLHCQKTWMIHPLNFDVQRRIRVWLVALVGWLAPHAPTLSLFILSSHRTAASQLQVT